MISDQINTKLASNVDVLVRTSEAGHLYQFLLTFTVRLSKSVNTDIRKHDNYYKINTNLQLRTSQER